MILIYFLNRDDTSNRMSPSLVCSFISMVGHLPKFDIPPEKLLPFLTKVSSVPLYFASFLKTAVIVDSFAIASEKKRTRKIKDEFNNLKIFMPMCLIKSLGFQKALTQDDFSY